MTFFQRIFLVSIGVCLACAAAAAQAGSSSPWRRSDEVLLQLCFNQLDIAPPPRISVQAVAERSAISGYLVLVARTLGGQPVYQGAVGHPDKLKSVLYQVPGSQVHALVAIPADLESRIDMWKDIRVASCTADAAAAYHLLNGDTLGQVACPQTGSVASLKVAASAENALLMRDVRERGPGVLNGLQRCNEPAYPPAR